MMVAALSLPTSQLPTTTPPLAVSLFGAFNLTVHDQTEVSFRSNKARALLAYLLLTHAQPILRTTLSELLWPDYHPESARVNLRQTLANLRDSIAPYELLYTDRNHVQLNIDRTIIWCDAILFSELLDECQTHSHRSIEQCLACQDRLRQAIALYEGAFLQNFPNIDSPIFSQWLQAQRLHFANRYTEAQALLSTARPQRGNLPPSLTPLIGRTQEVAELIQRLQHSIYRCSSLVGPGGIGKTRLARAVGEQMQAAFPDGVWMVPLGALAPTSAAETPEQLHDRIATAIAMSMGYTLSGATHPAEQVTTYLAHKTALLILDSFEHLTAGAAWLPTVLAAAPQLRLLITTRHRLPLQSQLVYQVGGLGMPPEQLTLGLSIANLIAQYASLQLFVERAESAQMSLAFDPATIATINRLCRFVEGSPWAIEVAVSLLDKHTPATLLVAIQSNYRLLSTDLLDLPTRQRSAEAVFLTAWALLSPAEAKILAHCAVFRGGFQLEAAQTVVAATPAILDALVQKSLLQPTDTERYSMHDLVRQFAGEQLAQNPAAALHSQTAHATYFTALLATWQPNDAVAKRFRTAVMQDWDNVQAAWAWAVANGQVLLLQQGVKGLAEFYEATGLYLECVQTLGAAVAQVRGLLSTIQEGAPQATGNEAACQTLLAHLLLHQAHFLTGALGQLTAAAAIVTEVVAWGQRLGDPTLTAWGYYEDSVIALFQGDYERQRELLHLALPLAQQQGDRYQQAYCLQMIGINLKVRTQYAAALQALAEALTLAETMGASRLALLIYSNIGTCHYEAGNFVQALATLPQLAARAQQMAENEQVNFATLALGAVSITLGDYANARHYVETAYQAYVEMGNHVMGTQALGTLADLFLEMGEMDLAAAYCQRALAASAEQTYDVLRALLLVEGKLHVHAGNWSAARATYERAYALIQPNNLPPLLLTVQAYLAAVDLAQGDAAAALIAVEPVLTHFADTVFSPTQRPQELLLIAYEILVANADSRAQAVLAQAWACVQAQAAKIDDPRLCESFLTNVAVNRTLRQLLDNRK